MSIAEPGPPFPEPKEKALATKFLGLEPFDYQTCHSLLKTLSPEAAFQIRIFAQPKNPASQDVVEGRLARVMLQKKRTVHDDEKMIGIVILVRKAGRLSDTFDNDDVIDEFEETLYSDDYDFFYSLPKTEK